MKTTLKRGPKADSTWTDTPARARRRADALADLHGVQSEETPDGYVVDASDWYTTEKERTGQ